MKFVAITGSIGCGKTTIATLLRQQGFVVHDVDKWVKLLYYKKDFLDVIFKNFPETFDYKGFFNKRALRNLVFENPCKLKVLEDLIHPFLTEKLKKIIRYNKNIDGLVFVDVALLYEMGWNKYFDCVVVADVDKEKQKLRVMKRDNVSAEDFDKIDRLQMKQEDKKEKADFVINTGESTGVILRNLLSIIRELELCRQ